MVKDLKVPITKVDKIFHLADIHIRTYKRHQEYIEVFNKTFQYIKQHKTANSIIYVAGDVVHSKTDMSPELVMVLSCFFKGLSDLCPTVVILGNHDTNLNNPSRVDALKPIMQLLRQDNLILLEENGYYKLGQVGFNHMKVDKPPTEFLPAAGLNTPIKIALHHGAVNQATTDTAFKVENQKVSKHHFDGHDLALLGDIHKRQTLQIRDCSGPVKKPTITYAGSLIQQNHGESLDRHGLLVWNLEDFTYEEVDIPNDYGYFTLMVEDGKIINWTDNIPSKPRIRVQYKNTPFDQRSYIETLVRKDRSVQQWTVKYSNELDTVGSMDSALQIGDVRDVEYQNKLLGDFLSEAKLSKKQLQQIFDLNKETNSKLAQVETARNVNWVPIEFEFDNMFSYGEGNYVNFQDLKGSYGVFAPNAFGKSTLLDSLCFCIFDRCSKTYKASEVLNSRKDWFKCKLTFTINGKYFVIEKVGKKTYNDHVKVDVDFYTFDKNNNKVYLNGEKRNSTTKIIKTYVGSYEDFILTALSVQNNGSDFVNKSQRERRELLVQFLDITLYEQLYTIAYEEFKEVKAQLKLIKNKATSNKLAHAINKQEATQQTIDQLSSEIEDIKQHKAQVTLKKLELIKSLYKLQPNQKTEQQLNEKLKDVQALIKDTQFEISELRSLFDSLHNTQLDLEEELDECPYINQYEYDKKQQEKQQLNKLQVDLIEELSYSKAEMRSLQTRVEELQTHEYDPNCKFCVKNSIVKHGLQAQQRLKEISTKVEDYRSKLKKVKQQLTSFEDITKVYNNQTRLILKIQDLEKKLDNCTTQIENKSESKRLLQESEKSIQKQLDEAKKFQQQIKHNKNTEASINKLEAKEAALIADIKDLNLKLKNSENQLYNTQFIIKQCQEELDEIKALSSKHDIYRLYLDSIKSSGVPYKIIELALPKIQNEVNRLLHTMVDFQVLFETDEKNINTSIVYGEKKLWPLESTSGMERFISSLAIRTALIANTTLPKPNFICIDEGFGVLDSDNLSNITTLFEVLKNQFKFILSISHLDTMRDVVDSSITISKQQGYSHVRYGV